jgi:osmotically-inducible protein OsmY
MLSERQDITMQIYTALNDDPRTEGAAIEVIEKNGFITLVGEVESADIKQAAKEIAGDLPGVLAVLNELAVTGSRRS